METTPRTAGKSGPGKCGARVSSAIVLDFLRRGRPGLVGLRLGFGVVFEFELPSP